MTPMFSSFDVYEMIRELKGDKGIVGMRVKTIYEIPKAQEVRFKLFGRGRRDLVISKNCFYLTRYPKKAPMKATSFAMFLRKRLKGLRILGLDQINFDRLFQIEFGFEEKEYILISELFGKGNLILCDSASEILCVLKREVWKDRELLPHKKYLPPPTKLSPFISFEEFQRHGIEREKDLANKFNLGGIYAREIFLRAESNDPKALYKAMHSFEKKPNIAGERVLPYELIIFKNEKKEYFESFTEAVDEFYGRRKGLEFLETQREALSKRERILESQKRMIEEFQKKRKEYKRKAELLYENYTLVETLLNNLKEERKRHDWKEVLEKVEENQRIRKLDYKNKILVLDLGEEVKLDFTWDVNKNAQRYFELSKKMERKLKGALKAIAETEKKMELEVERRKTPKLKEIRRREWYERFRWFYSSEGFLVLGGRDANGNEILVKRYMEEKDLYLHADLVGAPHVVIKNGRNAGEKTLYEAGIFAVSFSSGWGEFGALDAFWVYPEQVSKTPPSGEYLKKGAFQISGKKNFLKNLELKVGVGIYDDKVMCGPLDSVKKNCKNFVMIIPGEERKERLAKYISKLLDFHDIDEIVRALPSGKGKISK